MDVLEKEENGAPLEIVYAACIGCPAGGHEGLCHHVFALLIVLEYYSPKCRGTDLLGPTACTSQPKQWGPRFRNIPPQPSMQIVVEKAKMEGERKRKPNGSTFFESRGRKVRIPTAERMMKHRDSLRKNCRLLPLLYGALETVQAAHGLASKCGALPYQLRTMPVKSTCDPPPTQATSRFSPSASVGEDSGAGLRLQTDHRVTFPSLPFSEHPPSDMDLSSFEECITLKEAHETERSTRG